jgi:Protein of unknown function (DUF551)
VNPIDLKTTLSDDLARVISLRKTMEREVFDHLRIDFPVHSLVYVDYVRGGQADTITVQEAWEAAGGNPGIKATKAELLEALRMLDDVCDEASQEQAQQPSPSPKTCSDCGKALSQTEIEYYGSTCEQCEGKRFHAVQSEVQRPSGGEVVHYEPVSGCRECRHADYVSGGWYRCLKTPGQSQRFDDEGRPIKPPAWCPLPTLATKPEPMTWRDIETAPKDGSLFLCWVAAVRYGETDEGQQYQQDASQVDFCQWRNCDESPNGGYFDACCGQIADVQHVTHWMPLPDAPGITSTSTKEPSHD